MKNERIIYRLILSLAVVFVLFGVGGESSSEEIVSNGH